MNHLQNEKSPYLRQHRCQPVDWYPWGREAFSRAQNENKPVLLSIGYSTCHWCHVMAHESFENESIAQKLNDAFIAVKVDREERPDLDSIYMRVCQGMTGSGGWPLTILMTPDQQPFFAATYLPPEALAQLLDKVAAVWEHDPESLRHTGRQIVDWLGASGGEPDAETPDDETLSAHAIRWFQSSYDAVWGGFGRPPKFPSAHNLLFLMQAAAGHDRQMRTAQNSDAPGCLAMARHTLRAMAQGGMYDHLGGGFARYSTDEKWLVPHFEKTLYDNALLAMAYSEAGYGCVAAEILDYVLRELTHPEGGFFCGQDADSDGEEGKFYLWSEEEIVKLLGEEKGRAFCQAYQIRPSGIPNRIGQPWLEEPLMKEEKQFLMDYRKERYVLGLDDKILTGWNGLMMAAMARVGRQQGRIDFVLAAEKAAGFIRAHLTCTSGRLWHRWRDGEAAHMGQLSDYAYLAWGLLELYRSTQKADDLLQAVQTAQWMEALFADTGDGPAQAQGETAAGQEADTGDGSAPTQEGTDPAGGYFETANDGERLIARLKETDDGALPSGNSVAALVLAELGDLTGERRWREAAKRQADFCRRAAQRIPAGSSFFLYAMERQRAANRQLICVTADEDFAAPRVREGVCVMVKTPANACTLGEAAPFTKSYPIPEDGVVYHLCIDGACRLPSRKLPPEVLA